MSDFLEGKQAERQALKLTVDQIMQDLHDEVALFDASYDFCDCQFPAGNLPDELQFELGDLRKTALEGLREGAEIQRTTTVLKQRLRTETQAALRLAEQAVSETLNAVEQAYRRRIAGYKRRPEIASAAITAAEVRIEREKALDASMKLSTMRRFWELPLEEWKQIVDAEIKALGNINAITRRLSEQILNLEKYIDDKRRLWVAVAAFLFAAFGAVALKAYEVITARDPTTTLTRCTTENNGSLSCTSSQE